LTIDPNNSALISRIEDVNSKRAAGEATVPSMLYEELATNPYLRPHDVGIQEHLGLKGASPEEVFAAIRRRKDNF
jgi:hydroxyacylglutathione hydrolase